MAPLCHPHRQQRVSPKIPLGERCPKHGPLSASSSPTASVPSMEHVKLSWNRTNSCAGAESTN